MARIWKYAKEYRAWTKMLARCYDEQDDRYALYGKRGITVCDRWREEDEGFHNFLADMGQAPTKKHTLEREDNDKGYSPENCRWATWKEQAQNRRTNVKLFYRGQTLTMAQWAEKRGMDRRVLWKRLKKGWPLSRAIDEPKRNAA
jgi:hypothetical protein